MNRSDLGTWLFSWAAVILGVVADGVLYANHDWLSFALITGLLVITGFLMGKLWTVTRP